jgi:hypothetical protein
VSGWLKDAMFNFWKSTMEWKTGIRHPDTPKQIFHNVWMADRIRGGVKGRCSVCETTISAVPNEYHELVYPCNPNDCHCQLPYRSGLNSHPVCDVCASMFRAMYISYTLKDRNYFREEQDDKRSTR